MHNAGDVLTIEDLRIVIKAVFEIRAKWHRLGVELGIHSHTLESIKSKCLHNPEDYLLELLTEWLKTEAPSWKKLIDALKSEIVGECNLAVRIEEEFCPRSGMYNQFKQKL